MSLIWFQPPAPSGRTVAEMAERLRPLGITVKTWQQTQVTYEMDGGRLIAQIGFLVVIPQTGEINVYPCAGIGDREMRILLGCAQHAFEKAPKKADGWDYQARGGRRRWWSAIYVAIDKGEAVAQAVAHHEASMHRYGEYVLNRESRIEVAG